MEACDVGEEVLPFILRCSKLPLSTVCRLLCCSKATAGVVHDICAGSMVLTLTPKLADRPCFVSWLSKHAVLLHSLKHEYSYSRSRSPDSSERLAAALARAAALPSGLMLRSLNTFNLSLVKATAGSLVCLDLSLLRDTLFPTVKEAAACITGMSSHLSSLKLGASWTDFDSTRGSAGLGGQRITKPDCGLHSLLAQSLPQLTALTQLVVEYVADAAIFKHAPPQLVELEAVGADDLSESDLELGHLTACTSLVLLRDPQYETEGWRVINAKDTLPPNLRRLHVVDCTSATPLLALTQLTRLSISAHCHMPVAELQRLSSMTQLQTVELGYNVYRGGFEDRAAEEGSAGWVFVPQLHDLELHRMLINPVSNTLQHLAACTNLTRLVWDETHLWQRPLNYHVDGDVVHVDGEFLVYRDGGLCALREALPASLQVVEFTDFIPVPDAIADEASIVMGLSFLREDIDALPHLQSCTMEDDGCSFSEAGGHLVCMVLDGVGGSDDFLDAFVQAYPDFLKGGSDSGSSRSRDDLESGSGGSEAL